MKTKRQVVKELKGYVAIGKSLKQNGRQGKAETVKRHDEIDWVGKGVG